jgi:hypothetical protein
MGMVGMVGMLTQYLTLCLLRSRTLVLPAATDRAMA